MQGSNTGAVSSSYDQTTNELSVILTGSIAFTQINKYLSFDSFIEEGSASGLRYWHTRLFSGSVDATNSIDENRQMIRFARSTEVINSTSYDKAGRPLTANGIYTASLDCFADVSYVYDDNARVYDEKISNLTGHCGGAVARTNRFHFDEDNNQVFSEDNLEDGVTTSDFRTTALEYTEYCKVD